MSTIENLLRGVKDVLVLQERVEGVQDRLGDLGTRVEQLGDHVVRLDGRVARIEGFLEGAAAASRPRPLPGTSG